MAARRGVATHEEGLALIKDVTKSPHSLLEDLRGRRATRKAVEVGLQRSKLALFFGHGTWCSLGGRRRLIDQQNIEKAKGGIVIAVACKSALGLGEAAVEAGVVAYLGFNHVLLFVPSAAEHFSSAVGSGIKSILLEGTTVSDGARKIRRDFKRLADQFMRSRSSTNPDGIWVALAANWDKDHVVVQGQKDAHL